MLLCRSLSFLDSEGTSNSDFDTYFLWVAAMQYVGYLEGEDVHRHKGLPTAESDLGYEDEYQVVGILI